MAIKKNELYSSLWASCDKLRGGMDASQYKDYILNNIRTKYKMMLDYGSTTVWETEDILTHAAGSLCHGWSALPVYYYEIFNGAKPLSALIP